MDHELSSKARAFKNRPRGYGALGASKSFTLRRPESLLENGLFGKILTSKFNQPRCYFSVAVYETADVIECT